MTQANRGITVVIGPGGIGSAVTKRLLEASWPIAVGYHSTRDGSHQAQSAATPEHALDVSDPDSCRAFFKWVRTEVGPVTGVVNCAGHIDFAAAVQTRTEHVDRLIADNLLGVINVCRCAGFSLMKAGGGAIVNLGSAVTAHAVAGLSVYAAAKAGIEAFSKTLALELAPYRVTCNVVLPGFVDCGATARQPDAWKRAVVQQIPIGRLASPEDVASLVQFLLSPQARYLTGQAVIVDGGWSLGSSLPAASIL